MIEDFDATFNSQNHETLKGLFTQIGNDFKLGPENDLFYYCNYCDTSKRKIFSSMQEENKGNILIAEKFSKLDIKLHKSKLFVKVLDKGTKNKNI